MEYSLLFFRNMMNYSCVLDENICEPLNTNCGCSIYATATCHLYFNSPTEDTQQILHVLHL